MQKLNEIAEALEFGQYKYALQVCNKALKKTKSPNDIAQLSAYKAVTLLSLARNDEAAALVDQVRKTNPTDPRLITVLAQALELLGKEDEVSALYEEASKKKPGDEEFAKFWFEKAILQGNIEGARKAAIVLNKLPNQRKYFYWLLTTWKLSAIYSPNAQMRALSIPMSSKLIDHALSTISLLPETTGEALLVLSIASAESALKFLQGIGKKWTSDIEIRRTYIDLLQNANQLAELRDFCEDEIEQGADDWKIVKGWVDGYLGCFRSTASDRDAILSLMAKLEKQFAKRNFALGAIYLSAAGRDEIEGLPSPDDLCVGYFRQYKRKAACFRDIQSYVANLPKNQQTLFLEEIVKQSEDEETPLHEIYIEVNKLKFQYMLESWTTDNQERLLGCWKVYQKSLAFAGVTEATDNLPADDAILLGCYTLVKAYGSTKQSKYLLQAALCLESSLEKSKYNFQFKLLLIRIYLLLGAVPLAINVYSTLHIKQIQNDTLAHVLLTRISTLYTDPTVLHQLALAQSIYRSNEDETPPQVMHAFQAGTYHNIPEFWDLWMRLRHSLSRAMLSREQGYISRANGQGMDVVDESTGIIPAGEIDLGELYDQRDLTVMMDCELPGNQSPDEFTSLGPLQKTATKILGYGQRMAYFLEHPDDNANETLEEFRTLKDSEGMWSAFKRETTAAETRALELMWDIYQCHLEVVKGKADTLESLADTLEVRIQFGNLDGPEVNWENLHIFSLLLEVCRSLLSLASTCLARKKQPFKVGARKIAEAVSKALADSVEKLRAKQEACATQATGKTSVLDENEYMKIIRDIIDDKAEEKLTKIVENQGKIEQIHWLHNLR